MHANALRILVTGSAGGIGEQAARQLARQGHHVIVADRNAVGGEMVARSIRQDGGSAEFRSLDLADLHRVRGFAEKLVAGAQPLDVLISNAGLLPPKQRSTTVDGFELAFGVAYLGHFALAAQLMPALLRSKAPRVVSVSSNSHPSGKIDFDNLQLERGYTSSGAYTNSKLACLMFAFELQRRASAAGIPLLSVGAHPGFAVTAIADGWAGEGRRRLFERAELIGYRAAMRFLGGTAMDGARSLIHAAVDGGVSPGAYYGPTGFLQTRGNPGRVRPARKALDASVATRLWEVSERLTGASWPALDPAALSACA